MGIGRLGQHHLMLLAELLHLLLTFLLRYHHILLLSLMDIPVMSILEDQIHVRLKFCSILLVLHRYLPLDLGHQMVTDMLVPFHHRYR